MKTIRSSNGLEYCVSDEDYDYLKQFKWYSKSDGYAHCWELMKTMNRVVIERMGFADSAASDHIDRNVYDNRRCNLRPATKSQNGANTGPTKRNTSGYRGVQFQRGAWAAMISIDQKYCWIGGGFPTKEEAAIAYDLKAREVYGDFAHINIPNPDSSVVERVLTHLRSPKKREGKSRFIGVCWTSHVKRWRAIFSFKGKRYHCGYFDDEEEAARTVDSKKREIGYCKHLNFFD